MDTGAVSLKCQKGTSHPLLPIFSPTHEKKHLCEGESTRPTKAISAASSPSDAQIKSLLTPCIAASQGLGLFYHQRIIFGAHRAFRDLSLPSTLNCAAPAVTVSPVSTFRDPQDDTCQKTATSRAVSMEHVMMPASSAFCWLPSARAIHNI